MVLFRKSRMQKLSEQTFQVASCVRDELPIFPLAGDTEDLSVQAEAIGTSWDMYDGQPCLELRYPISLRIWNRFPAFLQSQFAIGI